MGVAAGAACGGQSSVPGSWDPSPDRAPRRWRPLLLCLSRGFANVTICNCHPGTPLSGDLQPTWKRKVQTFLSGLNNNYEKGP